MVITENARLARSRPAQFPFMLLRSPSERETHVSLVPLNEIQVDQRLPFVVTEIAMDEEVVTTVVLDHRGRDVETIPNTQVRTRKIHEIIPKNLTQTPAMGGV